MSTSGVDPAGPRLQRLRPADLAAVGGDGRVVAHVLRLERPHPQPAPREGAAQARHQQRLAGVRAGALDHQRAGHAGVHGGRLAADQARPAAIALCCRAMFAMVLDAAGPAAAPGQLPDPAPGPGQVLVRVKACAVCRTDLHVVDGELPHPKLPLIPGHEIVGEVLACGPGPAPFAPGQRVGIPWLGHTCGACPYCRDGRENLCDAPGLHRLHAGRRLRRARRGRRRLLLPPARPLRRRRGRTAAVRRPDRLPHPAHGRRRRAASASGASAPPPTSWPRSPATRAASSTPSPAPATRRPRTSPAAWAPPGPATRTRRRRPSSTPP